MPKNTSERIIDRPLSGRQTARVWSGSSSTSAGGTTDSTTVSSILASEFITLNADALLTNERYLAVSDALTKTDGGAGAALTIGMATPGTLTATSTNVATGAHTHAITASAAPGAAESLLKSTSAGLLTLPQFTATTKVTTPLIDTSSGVNLSLTPASGVTVVTGRATITSDTEGSGSGDQTYQLSVSKSGSGSLQLGTHGGYPAISGQGSGSSYRLLLNPENGGNVGVGMTDPTYKLDVTGTLRATTSLTTPLLTTASNVDLVINPAGTGAVQFPNDQTLRTSDFDSSFPIEGWQINEVVGVSGYSALTIGKIQADELAVRVFVADEVRVDRGDEFWTKSYGIVAESFTTPGSVGGTVSVMFEDSPALAGAIFTNNDWVLIRKLDIDTGITLSSIWGQVATYVNNSDGTQSWTFTLRTSHTAIDVTKGSLSIDFGASGAALIHLSVIDAAGAPYIKMRKWAGANPYTPSNFTTYVQLGELGSTGNAYVTPAGYGLYVRSTGDDSRFLLADDNGLQIRGASFKMYDGAAQTVDISSTDGSMKLGTDVSSSATTAFDFDAATGDLSITGDLYTSDVYLTEDDGILINVGSTESIAARKAITWYPDITSISGDDPILSIYAASYVGGDVFSVMRGESTTDISTLRVESQGYDSRKSYIELVSRPSDESVVTISADTIALLGWTDPITMSDISVGGDIAVSGTVDGVDIAAFKTAYDSHTHSGYLATSGGTLTGTLITDVIRPAANNTDAVGDASYYYNAGYFNSLYVNTIVGTPSYSHNHAASDINSGTLDFARMATTWTGALTLDADSAGTSNYVRWKTDVSNNKNWDLVARAHDYATSAQQNDLILNWFDGSSFHTVFQVDNSTRVMDFGQTPTVSGTAVSLSGHTHDDRYYTESEVTSLLTGYVPTTRTVSAGSGLTGGGALSGNVTISHDDTSTQSSVNNSGTTFIQDVTLDGYGHVTALGSVDVSTALDALYVNVTGDTMTGALTLEYSSAKLTVENTATTQYSSSSLILQNDAQDADTHWYIFAEKASAGAATGATTFQIRKRNSDGSVAATPFVVDASNNVILNNGYTAGGGTNGNVGIKKTPGAYALDVSGSMAASTSVLTPTVTTTSGNLSLTSVGGTVAVTGALTGSSTAAFTTSVSTPTVTTASGNLSLTSAGGTVAVTGALTGSSTGVFTGTLTAASDSDSTHIFGRVKIGSAIASDSATFAHFDYNTSTGFALAQYFGATYLNAASGQTVRLSNAGNAIATVSASGIDMQSGMYIGSSDYASQSAGWRVDQYGGGDFRYLYADQLHVKAFIADLEQALAGGQIISKSVAVLAADFVVPYAGGAQTLTVEDLPSASNMAVFEANDIVVLRSFSRAGGALTVGYCWGAVTSYADGAGVQTWTFTRSGTTTYNTITMRGTAQSSTSSAATSRSVTKPSGVTSGDVLVAVVTHDGSPDVVTATGWTSLGYVSGTDINAEVFYKVAGGSEGSSYTFSTVSSHAIGASVVAYYNVDTTYPIDDVTITENPAGANMTASNTWSSSTAGKLVFVGGVSNNTSVTPPVGTTEQIDTGSTGIRVYVADETLTTSGAQNRTATIGSSSYASIAASVILRPTYSSMTTAAGTITPGSTIEADSLVLDYGVSGNGVYEVTTVDGTYGANSPYAQVYTWTTHPATGSVVRTRMGNLSGISGATAGEYGLYAGDGTIGTTAQYLRISTAGVQLNNVPIKLYNAGTQTVNIDSAGTDIWIGPDSDHKKLYWNGTTLSVVGAITISSGSSGYSNFSDKPTTLNSINSSEYTKINSGLDSSGNLITKVLPGSTVGTPGGAGLFLGSDKMGYYSGSRWLTYIDNSGNFTFSSATSAKLAWDGTDLYGTDGTDVQWYARASTGKFYAGDGAVILDRTGILVANDNTSAGITLHRTNAFSSSTKAGRLWALSDLSPLRVYFSAGRSVGVDGDASNAEGVLDLVAYNSSGTAVAELSLNGGSGTVGVVGDLDMNGNDIADVNTLTVAPPAGTIAVTLTTPANQTTGMIYLTPADNGSSYGPHFTVGRNSNASTPAAGFMYIVNRGNTAYAIWPDASGKLRIGTTLPTSAQDTSGTVIGSQSSSLDTKDVVEPFTDYSSALNAIVDAPLYDFTYKSGAYNGEQFTGLITDYSPTFGMDKDEAHPAGKSLNTVTAHGYTFAAIKALHNRIEQLENQVKALQHVN